MRQNTVLIWITGHATSRVKEFFLTPRRSELVAYWPGWTGPALISTNTGPSQAAGAARTGKPPADMPNPSRNAPHRITS